MTAHNAGGTMTTGPYGDSPYDNSPYGDVNPGPAAVPPPDLYQPGYQQPVYLPTPYPATGLPPQTYPAPYYAAPQPQNGLGTAALVLGIIGAALFFAIWPPVILGVLAIVFGAVGLGRVKRGAATNRGVAMAGLVLGIVAVVAPLVIVLVSLAIFAGATAPLWGI